MATAIQTTQQDDRIEVFMRSQATLERFIPLLGSAINANAFISSALILINSEPKLQACTTMSLYKSILRAASLELSLDPALRQGWIVPRPRKIKAYQREDGTKVQEHWIQEANFQPHYNGTRNLAERTGRYRVINVSPIYEGQRIQLDQMTGLHYIILGETFTIPEQSNRLTVANTMDVTNGKPDKAVIGYLGYYETTKGIKRTVYMTISEIHKHAETWAGKNYNADGSAWKDPKKLPYMEMKTVFIQLTKTMDLSGREFANLRKAIEIENGDDFSDLEAPSNGNAAPNVIDVPPEAPAPVVGQMTYETAAAMRVETPWGNLEIGSLDLTRLSDLYWNEMISDNEREAIRLVLMKEYQMDAPEKPARSREQNMQELGFGG